MINRLLRREHLDELSLIRQYFNKNCGLFVDVGAHYGGSVVGFAKKGWECHCFEPSELNRKQLLKNTSAFRNIKVNQEAVSAVSGEIVEFYESKMSSGISSIVKFHKSQKVTPNKVKTVALKDYLKSFDFTLFDRVILKSDTEGNCFNVLKGYDFNLHRKPDLILVEFEDAKSLQAGYTTKEMLEHLHDLGYYCIVSEWFPIERYGVRHRWNKFYFSEFNYPKEDVWGNIIAFSDEGERSKFSKSINYLFEK